MRSRPRDVDRDVGDDAPGSWREDDDAIGDQDRLGDAVGDHDDRRRRAVPQPQQLEVEAFAAQRIERAERFVEQEHGGLERKGAGERHALAVPPDSSDGRESADCGSRPTRSISVATRAAAALGRPAGEVERVGDVVGGRAPRQQARLLEDQADARVGPVDRRVVELGRAAAGCEQAGDDAQERRLAAAVRADQGDDAAARDGEVDAVEDREAPAGAGRERERQVVAGGCCRSCAGRPRAPPRPRLSGRRSGAVAG